MCELKAEAETFGGVFGCKEHEADEVCKTCFDNFVLSEDKSTCSFMYSTENNHNRFCQRWDTKGNCLLCSAIDYMLYNDGMNPVICIPISSGGFCEVTHDKCNCITCKPGFDFNDNGKCVMKDGSTELTVNRLEPIRGCVKYKSKTECE